MHVKLSFFLIVMIVSGSIFVGMTANNNFIVQKDYEQKQKEIEHILDELLGCLAEFKDEPLSDAQYDTIFSYFNAAKEQMVFLVEDLKKPMDSKTKLLYQFINKTNAAMIYVCSSLKDNPDIWNEGYFSMVVELIKRMDYCISLEELNYSKMKHVLNEMEVLITLL